MNLNDVSDAFDGFLQPLTGMRVTDEELVDGRPVENREIPFSFNGVVQNATAEDLKVLEEGDRTEEAIKIHATFKPTDQVKALIINDVVDYRDDTWLIANVASRYIGNYQKAIATRQSE